MASKTLRRTPLSPWDTLAPLCVGCVSGRAMFSLIPGLPSPTSASGCPPLFGWFIGTIPESDSSETCLSAVRRKAFSDRSRLWLSREDSEVSRFSCMLFLCVRGFSDYAGPACRSRNNATNRVAFPSRGIGRRPWSNLFSKLNSPAHRCPCLRFN
jgi:hypothetical protein